MTISMFEFREELHLGSGEVHIAYRNHVPKLVQSSWPLCAARVDATVCLLSVGDG